MLRLLYAAFLALSVVLTGCSKDGSPEQVADAFADAYFRQMNQDKAKEYTALGATAMLDKELKDVEEIRKGGYTPDQAEANVSLRRGETTKREQRVRVPYEVTVRGNGAETIRDADIELAQIQGVWKVVRVGLKSREAPKDEASQALPAK
ncbi:MAG: hypothetical protein L6Q76_09330 [Polyangiaceae bacterium]|nr:hypothetical protein [Polyangiaceae bacterium]